MSEQAGEKVFVLKFRGGIAGGVYRLALRRVPPRIVVERDGARCAYLCAGEEPQTRDVYKFDPATKQTTRERVVEAYYQIYTPEAAP